MFKFLVHKYISCQKNDFFALGKFHNENQWNIHSDLFWVTERKRDKVERVAFFLGGGWLTRKSKIKVPQSKIKVPNFIRGPHLRIYPPWVFWSAVSKDKEYLI